MNIQDNISDMLIRIKNGYFSKKNNVICSYSNMKFNILKILKFKKFIIDYKLINNNLNIFLKYNNNKPAIKIIKRISKPSLRIYYNFKNIYNIKKKGIFIVSTSKGLMTNIEAKKKIIGGEIVCYIL